MDLAFHSMTGTGFSRVAMECSVTEDPSSVSIGSPCTDPSCAVRQMQIHQAGEFDQNRASSNRNRFHKQLRHCCDRSTMYYSFPTHLSSGYLIVVWCPTSSVVSAMFDDTGGALRKSRRHRRLVSRWEQPITSIANTATEKNRVIKKSVS